MLFCFVLFLYSFSDVITIDDFFLSYVKQSTNIKTIMITLFPSFRNSLYLNNNETASETHIDRDINRHAITEVNIMMHLLSHTAFRFALFWSYF